MNGGADLGGMMGFGPVVEEQDEPNFHAAWEQRAMSMVVALGACGQWNLDESRFSRESLPPADYLPSEDQTQDPHVLRAIGRAWGWRRRMEAGEFSTIQELAPDSSGHRSIVELVSGNARSKALQVRIASGPFFKSCWHRFSTTLLKASALTHS